MQFVYTDGGRQAAGFSGRTGDCVVRAVAIATEQDYMTVYRALSNIQQSLRRTKHNQGIRSARTGVNTRSKAFRNYMMQLGWKWTATMHIGSGCKVHLTDGELPSGRLIVAVSRHYTTVINGVIYDAYDPQRSTMWFGPDGKVCRISDRCVYGYWKAQTNEKVLVGEASI